MLTPDPSTEALDTKLQRLEMEARAHIDPARTLMRLTPEARETATCEQLAYDRVLRRADRMEAARDALAARLSQAEDALRAMQAVAVMAQRQDAPQLEWLREIEDRARNALAASSAGETPDG